MYSGALPTGSGELHISDAIHMAALELSEAGTEASAATGMVASLMCLPPDDEVDFYGDQPFLVVIQLGEITTFLGRITGADF